MNKKVNSELVSKTATHISNGEKVKVFTSTMCSNTVTGEILEGNDKGKWTTVYLDKAIKL